MLLDMGLLIICLGVIVLSSYVFCNALEHLGEKLGVSDGVTGSIFAAIATTLPETIIPIIALLGNPTQKLVNNDVSIGAILGAPLMLSTLSLFVMALFTLKSRGIFGKIKPNKAYVIRDLKFFLLGYSIAFIAAFVSLFWIKVLLVILLILIYSTYLSLVFRDSNNKALDGDLSEVDEALFVNYLGIKTNYIGILLQILISLVLLLGFAHLFIEKLTAIATYYKISAFLLSLIIIPIATELPEKVNSIIWVRKNKDTLAIANITGAMVFQGTLLPILGILFTPWELLSTQYLVSIVIAVIATLWIYLNAKELKLWVFGISGLLYLISILISIYCR